MKVKLKYFISITLVLFAIGAVGFLSKLPGYLQNQTIKVLQERLGRKVSFSDVEFNYFTATVRFNELKIMEKDEKNIFISTDSLHINVDPSRFIFRTLYLKEISLIDPKITVKSEDGKKNFDDIIKRLASRSKEKDDKSRKFLKKIQIQDISIDKFKIKHKDAVIESEDVFTLKEPNIFYENKILKFNSDLNLSDAGSINIEFMLNLDTGDLKGKLDIPSIDLSKFQYIKKFIPKLKTVNGIVNGKTSFSGNIKGKEYNFSGNFQAKELNLEDDLGKFKVSANSLDVASFTFLYPKLDISLGKVDIDTLNINSIKTKTSSEEKNKSEQAVISENGGNLNFDIEELNLKNSSIAYQDYLIKNIHITATSLKSKKNTSFPLAISLGLNDSMNLSSKLKVKILNDIKMGMDFKTAFSFHGDFESAFKNLSILNDFKSGLPYKFSSDKFQAKGSFNLTPTLLELSVNSPINSLKLIGQNNMLHDMSLDSLSLKNKLTLDLHDKSYKISGPVNLKNLLVSDKENHKVFSGDLNMVAENIEKEAVSLASLSSENIFLDMSKKVKLSKKTDNSNEVPIVDIESINLKGVKLILKELFLEDFTLTGSSFSTVNGSSQLTMSAAVNGSIPVTGKGSLKISPESKNKSFLSRMNFQGDFSSPNIRLEDLSSFLKNSSYRLQGRASLDSKLHYSSNAVSTDNTANLKEVRITKPETDNEFYFKNSDAKFKLDLKKDFAQINNGIFSVENFNGNFSRYKIDGDDLLAKVELASKKQVTINKLDLLNPYLIVRKKQTKKDTEKKDRTELNVKKLLVKNGKLDIIGKRKYDIRRLNGEVNRFSTSKNKKFDTNFNGIFWGSGKLSGTSTFMLSDDWDFSLKTMLMDSNIDIEELDLTNFDEVISTNFPKKLNSGTIFYKGTYDFNKGEVDGKNKILLKDLSFGVGTGNYLSLPLDKAVGNLKDENGDIDLNIPVSGSLNNPNFSFSKQISQGIRNIIIKSVASSSIKSIIKPLTKKSDPKKSESVDVLYFQYLSDELETSENKKLDIIAEKLISDQDLQVHFVLFTDANREMELIRLKSIGLAIFRGDINEVVSSSFQDLINSRGATIREFFSEKGLESRITIKASNEPRDFPLATVNFSK